MLSRNKIIETMRGETRRISEIMVEVLLMQLEEMQKNSKPQKTKKR